MAQASGLHRLAKRLCLVIVILLVVGFPARSEAALVFHRAHAHNDYEHSRPLQDALADGFGSVEADVYLVAGQLLVGHDRKTCTTNRTLKSLYLDPLQERVKKNGGVYPGFSRFTLWVDIKIDSARVKSGETTADAEAMATCQALATLLEEYSSMLTSVRGATINPVEVVVTGSHPKKLPASPGSRFLTYDSASIETGKPVHNDYTLVLNGNWTHLFQWRGTGPMPANEERRLKALIAQAHHEGKRVRFWATPESPEVWKKLLEADVDWIGTDRLKELVEFLKREDKESFAPN